MLTKLSIGNFKAFGKTQHIPLKPITLVFGANSSGKSSIIHSLLLMNHVVQTANLDVSLTSLGGESVDLGGFNQYIFRRNLNSSTELAFHFDDPVFIYDFNMHNMYEDDGYEDVTSLKISVLFRLASESERLTALPPNKPTVHKYEVTTNKGNLFALSFTNEIFLKSVLTFSDVNYQHPILKVLFKYFAEKFKEHQYGFALNDNQIASLVDKVLNTLYFAPELLL